MSTKLIYRNLPPRGSQIGGVDLKNTIGLEIWGESSPPLNNWKNLNREHLPYLRGLNDGGVQGARELIDLVEKFDEIEICISE